MVLAAAVAVVAIDAVGTGRGEFFTGPGEEEVVGMDDAAGEVVAGAGVAAGFAFMVGAGFSFFSGEAPD